MNQEHSANQGKVSPPPPQTLNDYMKGYITYVQSSCLLEALTNNRSQMELFLNGLRPEDYIYTYAEGKWTVGQVLGHIIDSERIFSYRILRISRGDATPLPGYDENFFAAQDEGQRRTPEVLIKEYLAVRASTLALIQWLTDDMWDRPGTANGQSYTARIIGWMLAGHEMHHLKVLNERYILK